jgi:hypothetical protein
LIAVAGAKAVCKQSCLPASTAQKRLAALTSPESVFIVLIRGHGRQPGNRIVRTPYFPTQFAHEISTCQREFLAVLPITMKAPLLLVECLRCYFFVFCPARGISARKNFVKALMPALPEEKILRMAAGACITGYVLPTGVQRLPVQFNVKGEGYERN